jgi:hypothetical protein
MDWSIGTATWFLGALIVAWRYKWFKRWPKGPGGEPRSLGGSPKPNRIVKGREAWARSDLPPVHRSPEMNSGLAPNPPNRGLEVYESSGLQVYESTKLGHQRPAGSEDSGL